MKDIKYVSLESEVTVRVAEHAAPINQRCHSVAFVTLRRTFITQ